MVYSLSCKHSVPFEHSGKEGAIEDTQMNGHNCFTITFYFQKQMVGKFEPEVIAWQPKKRANYWTSSSRKWKQQSLLD